MLALNKAAIFGATGPTGKSLVGELLARGIAVRVISRNARNLDQAFAHLAVERFPADAVDGDSTARALEGCDLAVDCIGLPAAQMRDHPRTASHIAAAAQTAAARLVHVSSYWAYLPAPGEVLTEEAPRQGGPLPVRMRREAEDIMQAAGAAVAHLPDFYGPEVHGSSLQNPLRDAAAGKSMNWIGSASTPREYAFVPDAMKAVARLALSEAAYGRRWIVPGPGPITAEQVAAIASRHLGRRVAVRGAGPLLLRLVSLFSRDLRDFLPMVPFYMKPIRYDGSRLRELLGELPATPYEKAIPRTLDWLLTQQEPRRP
jgi:nucleoside-diphosphate-sugar epimerase